MEYILKTRNTGNKAETTTDENQVDFTQDWTLEDLKTAIDQGRNSAKTNIQTAEDHIKRYEERTTNAKIHTSRKGS